VIGQLSSLFELTVPSGAVELPLACAAEQDANNLGYDFWRAGTPPEDPRCQSFEQRRQCYELILDSISVFEEKYAAATDEIGKADALAVRDHAYNLAFTSADEIFHSTLYDWLIGRSLADDLMEVGFYVVPTEMPRSSAYRFDHLFWKPTLSENQQLCKS
jgi:nuclear pore complex protein Nup155